MGLKPGQANEYYKQGGLDKYSFANNPELHKKAIEKSVEVRKKKKEMKDTLRDNLDLLMSLDVKNPKYKKVMSKLGIETEDQNNKMLVMVALFRRAVSGDVQAIKQITDMMDEYGIFGETQAGVTINVIPYKPTEPITAIKTEDASKDPWDEMGADNGPLDASDSYIDEWGD